jgi:hypothetical protein
VVLVATVDVLFVKVVNVAVVAHRDVSAVLAVLMVVRFGGPMTSRIALVVMPVVSMVQVPVVEVVHVADMFHRAMPTVRPVDVGMLSVDRVRGSRRHLWSSPSLIQASYPGSAQVYPLQAAAQPRLSG